MHSRFSFIFRGIFYSLILLITSCSSLQTKPAYDSLELDPAIRSGVLTNGLHYYIQRYLDPSNPKSIELRLLVKTGSTHEEKTQKGYAHFIEHMAFRGTKDYPGDSITDALQTYGVQLGYHATAYTSYTNTHYILQFPNNEQRSISKGFNVLFNWASQISFEAAQVQKEKNVIEEERRLRVNQIAETSDQWLDIHLEDSRYADQKPIGLSLDIANSTPNSLLHFYNTWYRPDRMGIVVVGDIDIAQIEKIIQRQFSGLSNPNSVIQEPIAELYQSSSNIKTRIVKSRDSNGIFAHVFLTRNIPLNTPDNIHWLKYFLQEELAVHAFNQRINERIDHNEIPLNYASINREKIIDIAQQYKITANLRQENITQGLSDIYYEILRAEQYGFDQNELEFIKKGFLSSLKRHESNYYRQAINTFTENLQSHFFFDTPLPEVSAYVSAAEKYTKNMTTAELHSAFRNIIKESTISLGLTLPAELSFNKSIVKNIEYAITNIKTQNLPPYQSRPNTELGVDEIKSINTIFSTSTFTPLEITSWFLNNDSHAVIAPSKNGDSVIVSAIAQGGLSSVAERLIPAGYLITAMMQESGVDGIQGSRYSTLLSTENIDLNFYIDTYFHGFQATVSRSSLPLFLSIIHKIFRSSDLNEHALPRVRYAIQDHYMIYSDSPSGRMQTKILKSIYGNNPYFLAPSTHALASVSIDQLKSLRRQLFGNASGYTFVLSGDLVAADVKPLISQFIGTIQSTQEKQTFVAQAPSIFLGPKTIYEMNPEDRSDSSLYYIDTEIPWSNKNDTLAQLIGKILERQLYQQLRDQLGLVYTVSVISTISEPPSTTNLFSIHFSSDPKHKNKIDTEINTIIEYLKTNSLPKEQLTAIKDDMLNSYYKYLRVDANYANTLATHKTYGRPFEELFEFPNHLETITTDDIQSTFKTIFQTQKLLTADLSP